ncbi:MAG: DUF2202 domain-containing protein [Saprospiraceae bacterium]
MKNLRISNLLLSALFILMAGFISCDDSDDNVVLSLSENEKADLIFMREEEKLARDVYLYFSEKYDLNIFKNISSSEQTHMDAVLGIMEVYGVEDPASTEMGVFTNADLQQLYNNLIAQGDASLVAALTVGATIEDVDILDLDNAIDATSKADIIDVYEMLACGSRNHMRGFSSQLDVQGETYTPQFITQEMYDDILNGGHENCGR